MAEQWFNQRRLEWQRHFDRLGEYLETLGGTILWQPQVKRRCEASRRVAKIWLDREEIDHPNGGSDTPIARDYPIADGRTPALTEPSLGMKGEEKVESQG